MAQMVRNGHLVDSEYLRQIEGARRDFINQFSQNMQFAPTILRLAFHDAGTYDAKTNSGGVNGSIRFEMSTAPNVGMQVALDFCEKVKVRNPKITYADLYQLAGVVAVEVTGGPKIHFMPGRKDATPQQDSGSIPNPNGGSQHLRDVFHRMGLSDKDIVVLSGAHTLGRAHQERSGFDGPFTRDPLTFDNSYYVLLTQGDAPGLIKFPTDKALMQDPAFQKLVQLYARDQDAFFRDYAISHKKMSELGFTPIQQGSHSNQHTNTHQHSNTHQHNQHGHNSHSQHHTQQHGHCPQQQQHSHRNHCPQQHQRPQCLVRAPCGYYA